MTKTQTHIQTFIDNQDSPVDFADIQTYLSTLNLDINKTTIYRNLEKLESQARVSKVLLSDQKQFWEKSVVSTNHYHLVCEKCKKIECVELESKLKISNKNFVTKKIELNLVGLCSKCQGEL